MNIDFLISKFSIPNVDRVVFQLRYFPNFMASNFKIESLPKGMPEQCIVGKLDGVPVRAEDCEHLRASVTNILVECLNDADSEVFHKIIPYKAVVVRDSQYEIEIVSDRNGDPIQGVASLISLLYPNENYEYAYDVKVTVTKARTWSANYKPIDNFERDLSQFDLDKFLKQPQTPKANNHYRVTPIPTKMTEHAAQVRVEPKG